MAVPRESLPAEDVPAVSPEKSFLVIDDEQMILDLIVDMFSLSKSGTSAATNGIEYEQFMPYL